MQQPNSPEFTPISRTQRKKRKMAIHCLSASQENIISATTPNKTAIPYSALKQHLKKNRLLVSPAELHGNLTGQLLANPQLSAGQWRHMILADYGFGEPPSQGLVTALEAFFDMVKSRLQEDDFSFDLLLPEDGALNQRAAALAEWANAFLSGLALGGLKSEKALSDEGREFLRDMAEIARLDEQIDDNQGEEADLMELQEYTRAGVMLLASDLLSGKPVQKPPADRLN